MPPEQMDVTAIVRHLGSESIEGAAAAVREEQDRLAAWSAMGDREVQMVHAIVRGALRRLLDSPHWLPGSVRLGDHLDIWIRVELDATQERAVQAAVALEAELREASVALGRIEELLAAAIAEEGDDGTAP